VIWLLFFEPEWKSYGWTVFLTPRFSAQIRKANSMIYKDQHQQANYREIHFQRKVLLTFELSCPANDVVILRL
jgi:hypothetical protein